MFYHINPNYRYQFFAGIDFYKDEEDAPVIDDKSTNEPSKRNLVGALKALYAAYGGEEELKNNAVDIIYKIADVVQLTNNKAPEVESGETKS